MRAVSMGPYKDTPYPFNSDFFLNILLTFVEQYLLFSIFIRITTKEIIFILLWYPQGEKSYIHQEKNRVDI